MVNLAETYPVSALAFAAASLAAVALNKENVISDIIKEQNRGLRHLTSSIRIYQSKKAQTWVRKVCLPIQGIDM